MSPSSRWRSGRGCSWRGRRRWPDARNRGRRRSFRAAHRWRSWSDGRSRSRRSGGCGHGCRSPAPAPSPAGLRRTGAAPRGPARRNRNSGWRSGTAASRAAGRPRRAVVRSSRTRRACRHPRRCSRTRASAARRRAQPRQPVAETVEERLQRQGRVRLHADEPTIRPSKLECGDSARIRTVSALLSMTIS
jgi:hypothetical protein